MFSEMLEDELRVLSALGGCIRDHLHARFLTSAANVELLASADILDASRSSILE